MMLKTAHIGYTTMVDMKRSDDLGQIYRFDLSSCFRFSDLHGYKNRSPVTCSMRGMPDTGLYGKVFPLLGLP